MVATTILALLSCCFVSGLMASNASYAVYAANAEDLGDIYTAKTNVLERAKSVAANLSQMQRTMTPSTTTMSPTMTISSGSDTEDLQQQQIIHIVLIALVVHVLVGSASFLIYCWCKTKPDENLNNGIRTGNTQWFDMQCLPTHHNNAPDLSNCPCPGC